MFGACVVGACDMSVACRYDTVDLRRMTCLVICGACVMSFKPRDLSCSLAWWTTMACCHGCATLKVLRCVCVCACARVKVFSAAVFHGFAEYTSFYFVAWTY